MPCVFLWKKTLESASVKQLVKRQASNESPLVLDSNIHIEYEIDIVENEAPFELVDSINCGQSVDAFTQTEKKSAFLIYSTKKFADNNKTFLFYTG